MIRNRRNLSLQPKCPSPQSYRKTPSPSKSQILNRNSDRNRDMLDVGLNKRTLQGSSKEIMVIKKSIQRSEGLGQSWKDMMGININLVNQKQVKQKRSYSFSYGNASKDNRKIREDRFMAIKQSILFNSLESAQKLQSMPVDPTIYFGASCLSLQSQFCQDINSSLFNKAFTNLCDLLNYTIDINSKSYFFKTLYTMCQFHEILEDKNMAFKYYCQYRQAASLMKDYKNLVNSLIGIARCICVGENSKYAIMMLKKGLQYAWYMKSKELEFFIYDELGELYCKLGDIRRASAYHSKYSRAQNEPLNSPLRILSKQKIQHQQQTNLKQSYCSLSSLFLSHLDLPIKHTNILQSLIPEMITARSIISHTFTFSYEAQNIHYQLKRLLENWMFETSTEEPNVEHLVESNQELYSEKKYSYIGVRNIKSGYRRARGKNNFEQGKQTDRVDRMEKEKIEKREVKKKMSLDEQIKSFVDCPGLDKTWYENIVKRVKNDQKHKLTQVKDAVLLNKNQITTKSKIQSLKTLFRQLVKQICH